MEDMHPWYRGFNGDIRCKEGRDANNYSMFGNVEQVDDNTILITELPIGKWTQDYKQFLESMVIGGPGAAEGAAATSMIVKDFKENHTDTTVLFTVSMPADKLVEACNEKGGIHKKFKLETSIATSNMHAFDFDNQIHKFENAQEIMNSFYNVRLEFYEKRKAYLVSKFKEEWDRLDNKVRFILAVINETIVVSNRKRDELLQELKSKGFQTFMPVKKGTAEDDDAVTADAESEGGNDLARGYDYLLSMKLWSLTMEKVQMLTAERDAKRAELDQLEATAVADIWLNDLDKLEEALDEFEEQFERAAAEEEKARIKAGNGSGRGKSKVTAKKTKKKMADSDEDSEEEFDDDDDSDFEDERPKKKTASSAKQVKSIAGPAVGTGTKIVAPQADAKPVKKERAKPVSSSRSIHTSAATTAAPEPVKEEPVEELSLAARLMNRMKIGLANQTFVVDAAPAPAPTKATGGGIKRAPKVKAATDVSSPPKKSEETYTAIDFAASYSPGTPVDKPAKKSKAVSKKPAAGETKKLVVPAAKKTVAKKKASCDSDEDEIFDDNDSDDDSVSGNTPVAPRAMPARARKPVVYDAGEDTDDDDLIGGESDDYNDEGDDESDFE